MAAGSITIKDGNSTSQTLGTFVDAASAQRYQLDGDSAAQTYTAAKSALAPVASPTVFFQILGSATKTVRIKRITLSGAATAYGGMPLTIHKCSDAGTLGSAVLTTITAVPHDSASSAATAVVSTVGTANYGTVPAAIGAVACDRLSFAPLTTAATSSASYPNVYEFNSSFTQSLVLRGVLQLVTVSFMGTALVSGGVVDMAITWVEDAS